MVPLLCCFHGFGGYPLLLMLDAGREGPEGTGRDRRRQRSSHVVADVNRAFIARRALQPDGVTLPARIVVGPTCLPVPAVMPDVHQSWTGQGADVPSVGRGPKVQASGRGHRDRWQLERGVHHSTRIRQGARGARIYALAKSLCMAATVDQDALDRVRPLFCGIVGGAACAMRDVVLDRG